MVFLPGSLPDYQSRHPGDEYKMSLQIKQISFLARLIIGGLFIYASAYKVLDPASFATSLRNYMILPLGWTNFVAITLPWVELGAGIFLFLGILTRPAALLTTSMLMVFLAGMGNAYWTGLDIDCGCFSSAAQSAGKIGLYHFVRDSCLLLISMFIVIFDRGHFSVLRNQPLEPLSKPLEF